MFTRVVSNVPDYTAGPIHQTHTTHSWNDCLYGEFSSSVPLHIAFAHGALGRGNDEATIELLRASLPPHRHMRQFASRRAGSNRSGLPRLAGADPCTGPAEPVERKERAFVATFLPDSFIISMRADRAGKGAPWQCCSFGRATGFFSTRTPVSGGLPPVPRHDLH